jgi:two-component system response regulator HydG
MMSQSIRILIVDDEEAMRESLAAWLNKAGYEVGMAAGGPEALEILNRDSYDLLLVDIKMPGMDGLELLGRVKTDHPDVIVVMITAYGSIESAVASMKKGAGDYLLKPFDPEQLIILIEKMAKQKALQEENERLRTRLAEWESAGFEDLIGQSDAMRAVFASIEDVAQTDAPILIIGETGTGKELVARAIHARSKKAFGPFVAVNCGAMSESLLESELFGHERGAFTGAIKARRGRLEMADQGTLFMDEIGEISTKMQVSLLRVLEEQTFLRLGGSRLLESDFRLISATHRDLQALIDENRFRQDFYYRINVITINVPPLRDRTDDVPLLAQHFAQRFAREMGKSIKGLTNSAFGLLASHDWPGNVRELRNVIERAVVVTREGLIGDSALTFLHAANQTDSVLGTLEEMEKRHIRKTLDITQWNVSRAAQTLGIDRSTLTRRMKKFGLAKPG